MEDKRTLREWYESLKGMINKEDKEYEDAIAFLDYRIELLDEKAEKSRIRNAKKKAEQVDELKNSIAEVLENAPDKAFSIEEMVQNVKVEQKGKVAYRLSALVKEGKAIASPLKLKEDGKIRTIQTYQWVV